MALAYFDDENQNNQSKGLLATGVSKISAIVVATVTLVFWAMFITYNPEDPSMLQGNGNSPTNALGYMGAYFADPLFQLLGRAVWVIPLSLAIWALRLFFVRSQANFINRMIFLPIALLVCSIFASTWVQAADWPFEELGMGGVFGDKVLTIILNVLPMSYGLSLFFLTVIFGAFAFLALCYVSGIQTYEIVDFGSKIAADVRYVIGLIKARITGTRAPAHPHDPERLTSENTQSQMRPFKAPAKEKPRKYSAMTRQSEPEITPISTNQESKRAVGTLSLNAMFGRGQNKTDTQAQREVEGLASSESQSFDEVISRKKIIHDEMLRRHYTAEDERANQDDSGARLGQIDHSADDDLMREFSGQSMPQAPMMEREPIVKAPVMKRNVSARARADAEPKFTFEAADQPEFEKPSLSLLQNPDRIVRHVPPQEALEASARQLEAVLDDYGVKGDIIAVRPGPVVTMYELEPAAGLKASRVIGLADDIARSMSALTARVATIPGRSVIGIELPNDHREMVLLREIFAAKNYGDSKLALPLALGKDIAGEPVVANLAKMPHLLIAGTTGSGKSVAINTMILSLLYHANPDEVRMIMIDPKMLELSVYDNIPHLLSPVVTDPKKAVVALKWVVAEMEDRYRKMSKMGVRNIDGYNSRVREALATGEGFKRTVQTGFDDVTGEPIFETEEYAPEIMPYIVVIVDEMADLMMVAGKEIEACIQRLAQMARASGIHLIMATQRPSVDVITGTIKANFPTRISFQVTSKIDSRTILGEMGAEQLLGMGDMLYMSGGGRVTRVHGPFVSDEEVEEVVSHLKAQGEPDYVSGVVEGPEDEKASDIDAVLGLGDSGGEDELYDQAVAIVARDRKCSTSYIQRKLSIGYNKAANLVERMEEQGVVSQANHVGKRDILVAEQ